MKKVLILCYGFPPFPGVGGRRWAKFAKELCARNFEIFVISAKNPFNEISLWTRDVENKSNLHVINLPLRYPKYLLQKPISFAEKLLYRISLILLKLFSSSNYYDRCILWEKQLFCAAEKTIRENNIVNIIASGAPFHLLNHAIKIKKKNQQINFIADFRDLWTSHPFYMGISSISKSRFIEEVKKEQEIIDSADFVMAVSTEILNDYQMKCKNQHVKFIELENGFDKDDIPSETKILGRQKKLKFIFTGTLYQNIEYIFYPFLNALETLKKENINIYNSLEFSFYGEFPGQYEKMVSKKNIDIIKTHGNIPLDDAYKEISESDIGMLFLIDKVNFSLSTKFCEYIAMKKKIIVFSSPGKTSDFIIKNNLGYAASPENMKEVLLQVVDDFKNGKLEFDSTFDVEQFSVQRLTDKLVACLK